MKTLYQILTQFQTDFAADIPDLVTTAGLTAFEEFVIGPSRKAQELALCVYKDEYFKDDLSARLSLIFQAQLYGQKFTDAVKYEDLILNYLSEYNPEEIGYNVLESVTSDTWPMEQSQGVIIYFIVTYSAQLDGCD